MAIEENQGRGKAEEQYAILEASDKIYNFPEDLAVLDEVNVNIQLFDFTPGEEKNVWANKALCSLLGVSLEVVQGINLIDCSETLRAWQKSLLQNIQVEKRTETSVKTISPGGKPISLFYTLRPIQLLFPGKTEPRTVVFSTALPINRETKADEDLILCQEMIRYTDVAQMLVVQENDIVRYANQCARLLWPDLTDRTKVVKGQDIINGREWASNEEHEDVLERYRSLTIHSSPFDAECRVRQPGGPLRWHRMTFTPCICPISGGTAVTINEVDTTKLHQQAQELEEARIREQHEAASTLRLLHAMIPEKIIGKIQHFFREDDDSPSDEGVESDEGEGGCRLSSSWQGHNVHANQSIQEQCLSAPSRPKSLQLHPSVGNLWNMVRPCSAASGRSDSEGDSRCGSLPDAAAWSLLHELPRESILDAQHRPRSCRPNRALYAEEKRSVSIIFSDVVGFSRISTGLKPIKIMDMLTDLFNRYDRLCDKHGIHKVETIGDGCIMAAGMLDDDCKDHRANALKALAIAKDMISEAQKVRAPRKSKSDSAVEFLQIRVGIHVGPITCGVLGKELPRFDVFGNAVNMAARMEQYGRASMVHVSQEFHDLVGDNAEAWQEPRTISIKNMGDHKTWLLDPTKSQQDSL